MTMSAFGKFVKTGKFLELVGSEKLKQLLGLKPSSLLLKRAKPMPYKILDPSGLSLKTTLEEEFNFLESEGFDFIASLDRFAIFHKPVEKPKRPYTKKELKNAGTIFPIITPTAQQTKSGTGS